MKLEHLSANHDMIDPERLGRALVVNVPFLINAFVKLILAFIDHRTRPKIRFNPDCTGEHLFAPEQLLADPRAPAVLAKGTR